MQATSAQAISSLRSWAQSKGIKLDKVDIQAEISTDQATLVAANDASAGETLLVVPDSVWVSAETIRKTKLGQALEGRETRHGN